MFRYFISCTLAVLCFAALHFPAAAAEVESGSVYCFSTADFSETEDLAGICITKLPDSGTTMLGQRVLREGDILTAEQVARMTFSPEKTELDQEAQLEYLPVFGNHVEPSAMMTLSIRGKEDKAPIAEDSAVETYKNLEITGKLKVTDPEGQPMTYTVTRQPRRGTVVITEDGSFTYTPKKNKVGIDSFTFTASDPAGKTSREATVTLTILKPTEAAQYTDTMGMDCRFAAEWMKNSGIFVGECVSGHPCFNPEKAVTRGEFVTMLVKALEIDVDEEITYTGYTDEIPLWLQPYLAAAVRSGLTAGLEEQETFGADTAITVAEAAVMLQNALEITEEVFSGEASLGADTALTRGSAAKILYQAVQAKKAAEAGL